VRGLPRPDCSNIGALKSRVGAIRLAPRGSGRLRRFIGAGSLCDQPNDRVGEPPRSLKSSNRILVKCRSSWIESSAHSTNVRSSWLSSPGCKHCYAEVFAERFRGVPGHPYEHGFDLRLVPEKLEEPLKWKSPRLVFVNSMSDLFHPGVPDNYIVRVAEVMQQADWHTFQVLTKRSERMRDLLNSKLRGTSGVVEPAASFVAHVLGRARTIYVGAEQPANASAFTECHLGKAGEVSARPTRSKVCVVARCCGFVYSALHCFKGIANREHRFRQCWCPLVSRVNRQGQFQSTCRKFH
jgi:hypothetical protein